LGDNLGRYVGIVSLNHIPTTRIGRQANQPIRDIAVLYRQLRLKSTASPTDVECIACRPHSDALAFYCQFFNESSKIPGNFDQTSATGMAIKIINFIYEALGF